MKILKTVLVGMVALALATSPAYAEPGKGKAKGHEKENQGKSNNGNQSINAQSTEKRNNRTESGRNQANLRANIPDSAGANNSIVRANHAAREDHDRSAEHSGKKEDKEKADKFFNALEHARWSYNPHDERGQGNMGKPRMRDPYGFDKDSGREKSERGRPIKEEELLLNLADILSINWGTIDWMVLYYQSLIQKYLDLAAKYPTYASRYLYYATYYQNIINIYTSRYTYDFIRVNLTDAITYSLTLNTPDGFDGTKLLVTTTLTSINDYNSWYQVYNPTTRRYEYVAIHYDAGGVVMEQTQEVVLGTDSIYTFKYDPPTTLTGIYNYPAFYGELSITVTEPVSGQSYTLTYDRDLYLYRCPYGKVYNAKTREPVVGAKVCVHFEDGSIVPLDKASNPTAKNPQITDATGRYGVKLQTDRKYYITAKADGYKDYKSEIFTEKWHVLREDIALTPLEQVAQK